MKSTASWLSDIGAEEILAIVGLLLMGVGIAMWSIAAALTVVGGLLLLFATWPYLASRRSG